MATEHDAPYDDERHESRNQRLDRNWNELLQELRVTQTGVQILAGFLLTLPFQARFAGLATFERWLYLVTVLVSCFATILLIAPVAVHRALFRRHEKDRLVDAADRLARAGLAALGLAVTGVVMLVFTVVLGRWQGLVAGAALLVSIIVFWLVIPRRLRERTPPPRAQDL
jgi:O-antigen/teichoic acid export membrane protein